MKIVKTASGKQTIKMSKKEWESIGKKAGWFKSAGAETPVIAPPKRKTKPLPKDPGAPPEKSPDNDPFKGPHIDPNTKPLPKGRLPKSKKQ